MTAKTHFRPTRRAIALEPRLLFDGAGAVAAVDGFADGPNEAETPEAQETQHGPQSHNEQDHALMNLFATMSDTAEAPTITDPLANSTQNRTTAEDDPFNPFAGTSELSFDGADDDDVMPDLTITVTGGTLELIQRDANGDPVLDDEGHPAYEAVADDDLVLSGMTLGEIKSLLEELRFRPEQDQNSQVDDFDPKITLTFKGSEDTTEIEISVTPVNDDPTIDKGVTLEVDESGSASFSLENLAAGAVLGDDGTYYLIDPDIGTGQQVLDQLMIVIEGLPEHGTLTFNGGEVTEGYVIAVTDLHKLQYHHSGDDVSEITEDSFKIIVHDGGGGETEGFLQIEIAPRNVAPVISGKPTLIEGQVKNVAPDINWGDDYDRDNLDDVTITISNVQTHEHGDLFYMDGETKVIIPAGASVELNAAELDTLSFEHNGKEPIDPDEFPSFDILVIDAGGGEGEDRKESDSKTITIKVQPNNDDPVLDNAHGKADNPAKISEHDIIVLKDLLTATDPDHVTPHPEQLVYTVESIPTEGELQLYIDENVDGGAGDGWIILGAGGRFTQAQIDAGYVRYVQTTNVTGDAPTPDGFTFTLRDSAFGYDVWTDPTDPKGGREGGVRDEVTGEIATQHFHIAITPDPDIDTGEAPREPTPGYTADPDNWDYIFQPTTEMTNGNGNIGWDEVKGGEYGITDKMLSYTIRLEDKGNAERYVEIPATETIYTLSEPPTNGTLQINLGGDNWQDIPAYGQFTQDDINSGRIRFVSDGSENHIGHFGYIVSDGTANAFHAEGEDNGFIIDITPMNDAPVADGGATTVREGETVYLDDDVLGMSDVDGSEQESKRTGEGAEDHLWFQIQTWPEHGDLERWDPDAGTDGEWVKVQAGEWLSQDLLFATSNGQASGLRFVHDGSEPLAYEDGPKVSFTYQVRDDLGKPGSAWEIKADSDIPNDAVLEGEHANISNIATATINITPVNDAPQVPSLPEGNTRGAEGDNPVTVGEGIDGQGEKTSVNKILKVNEGGSGSLGGPDTEQHLVAVDRDNTTTQRQYQITKAPTEGVLMLDGKALGVGSTFTQADLDSGKVTYRHGGADKASNELHGLSYNDKFHFVVSDGVNTDFGHSDDHNIFMIEVIPANDPPTVQVPQGPIKPDADGENAGKNVITGITIDDPDLTGQLAEQEGRTDFVQVTVRLRDANDNVVTDYTDISFKNNSPTTTDGLWAITSDGSGKILQIQGTREQVDSALNGLTVEFTEDVNEKYFVEIIADDRLRDVDGNLVAGANGGVQNEGVGVGVEPGPVYQGTPDWSTSTEVAGLEEQVGGETVSAAGNITSETIEIWVSHTNNPPELIAPDSASVDEDVRSRIAFDSDTEFFKVFDEESNAFDTEVQLTISVPDDHGTLHIGQFGEPGDSYTPLEDGSRAVRVDGDGTHELVLTGRAVDIQNLLNDLNKAGGGDGFFIHGLFYTSPKDVNHDLNGGGLGNEGDVTVTFSLTDSVPPVDGEDNGSDLGEAPTDPTTIEHKLALTIIPVNDAPEVTAGPDPEDDDATDLIRINDVEPTPIDGVAIYDVDGDDIDDNDPSDTDYVDGEHNDSIQVLVRLLDADGNALAASDYVDLGVVFSTTETEGVATALRPADGGGVATGTSSYSTDEGTQSALILRGTLDEINAWLAGLQIAFTKAAQANVDQHLQLEVIVDDRVRNENGSLKTKIVDGDELVLANGGNKNPSANGMGLEEIPDTDDFNVYSTRDGDGNIENAGTKVDTYGVYNVVSDTRELFVSSINDPAFITGDIENAAENDEGTVTLTGLEITDSDALPDDELTVTVSLPEDGDFTIQSIGGNGGTVADGFAPGTSKTVTLTGTLAEINDRLNQIVINLPDGDENGLPAKHWHGSFKVTIEVNDNGFNGSRPGSLPDHTKIDIDDDEEFDDVGEFDYAIPGEGSDDNALVTTRTLTFIVDPVNDAPVLTDASDVTLDAVDEDTDGGDGKTVKDLFENRFSDPHDDLSDVENDDPTPGSMASDPDEFWGIVIVGNASDSDQGEWQYKLPDGEWTSIDLRTDSALVLNADASLRFNPAENFHGKPGDLTVRLIETNENGDTTTTDNDLLVSGELIENWNTTDVGDTSRFSAPLDLTTSITNVNDRPTGKNADLVAIDEDTENPNGTSVQELFGPDYSDITDNQGENGADIEGGGDASSNFGGIAIVGNTADTKTQGEWQYRLSTGEGTWGAWTTIDSGSLSDTSALILPTDAELRFLPAENYNGTPPSLNVRLADTVPEQEEFGTAQNLGLNADEDNNTTSTWSETVQLGIVVNPVNDAPHFTHAPTNPTVTENNDTGTGDSVPPTALLGSGIVSDIDLTTTPGLGDAIFGAGTITVTLTDGFEDSGDLLKVANLDGIADFTGGTGNTPLVITLSDSATLAQVEAILVAITYENTSDNPTNYGANTTRGYTITLNDGKNTQGDNDSGGGEPEKHSVSGTITINAVNDPPAANDDTNSLVRTENDLNGNVITGEHTSGDGTEKIEGTDADPDTPIEDLRLITVKGPTIDGDYTDGQELELKGKYGTLYIDSEGGYRYVVDQNNPDVYGLDNGNSLVEQFEYTLTDGDTGADKLPTATLTITIHGDDIVPPTITPVDHTAGIDGDNIVHEAGLRPEAEIDDDTGEAFATGTINVNAPGGIKSVEIGGEIIDLDALKGASDTSPITIYSGTSEDDSVWKLEIIGFVPGEHEEETPEPESAPRVGEITYRFTLLQPIDNASDADHHDEDILLTVTDQANQNADGTLTIRIIDDKPNAANDEKTVNNDTDTAEGNALDNDTLGADRDVFVTDITSPKGTGTPDGEGIITAEGEHGTLVIQPDGEFTYTRHTSEPLTATEKFTYTIMDADGDESHATITIDIDDKAPEVTDGSGRPPSEKPVDPTDPDGEKRWVIKPDGSVNESGLPDGSTSGDGSQITTGTITFDKGDGDGDEHTVTITGKDGSPVELTGTPGQEIETPYGTVTITEFDPENGAIEYTYELKRPTSGDDTTDEFEVTIKDKDGDTTSVTVVIDIINDDPVAIPDTNELTVGDEESINGNVFENDLIGADGKHENGPVTGISSGKVESPAGGVGTPVEGQYGTITIDSDGNYTYTPDPSNETLLNLPGDDTVEEIFTYAITDADGDTSTATLTITIHGNTSPVAEPDTLTIPEDSTGTGNILTNDTDGDGDPLKVTGFTIDNVPGDHSPGSPVNIPGVGTITINEDGNYSFTPVKDWNGEVPTITYTVTDGKGGTDTSTLKITVTPVPDAFDDEVTTESGMPITFDPTDNDTFKNPDAKITDVTPGNNGKVTITPDGRISYTPDPGFEGTDTFTYTVTSGGVTETATVTVTVRGQHVDVPPPAFGDYTPPTQIPGTPGSPVNRDVVRDTSVYFHDEAFDRVDRMQLPFHPVAYVNRQVQLSQDERAGSDTRFYSNPDMAGRGNIRSTSIGAGLGADPNLFVQHAVRDTQSRADFLSRVVDGRLGRVSLSSDRALPTPDLFEADVRKFVPTTERPAQGQPDSPADPADAPDRAAQGQTPDNAAGDDSNAVPDANNLPDVPENDDLALHDATRIASLNATPDAPALIGSGAPSFTEQLEGGSARLPATLFSPHKAV